MQIGNFKVPEIRLELLVNTVLKKIYETVKTDQIQSKDLSKLLGYKYGTEVSLFKKINSMIAYGILEGRGIYSITKLGEGLLFPESPEIAQNLKSEAIFNVELWRKLFEKNRKAPPKDGLWVQLRNITEIDPATAKKLENRIYTWYMEDISNISDNIQIDLNSDQEDSSTTLRSSMAKSKQMSQQMAIPDVSSLGQLIVPSMGTIEINDKDTLEIARTYLDVLEKKIKEKKTETPQVLDDVTSQEATDEFNEANENLD